MQPSNENGQWSVAQVWNETNREERPLTKRDYIWASELGRAPLEVFLRCNAVPESNPINDRAKRKGDGGILAEWIVGSTLKRAGILRQEQQYGILEATPTTVKVTGRLDFIAGGQIDDEQSKAWLEVMELTGMPELYIQRGTKILEYLRTRYPNGLVEKPLEIKSLSGQMFDVFAAKETASKNHRLQLYHYMKTKGYEWGDIIYISRDDTRLHQVSIHINGPTKIEYEKAILELSTPLLTGIAPAKEKEVVWDEDMGKLTSNWNVRYSSYLTMLYGYENTEKFDEVYKGKVSSWNRVLGRIKNGDKMTPKNLEAIEEMTRYGFNPADLATKYSTAGIEEETTN